MDVSPPASRVLMRSRGETVWQTNIYGVLVRLIEGASKIHESTPLLLLFVCLIPTLTGFLNSFFAGEKVLR